MIKELKYSDSYIFQCKKRQLLPLIESLLPEGYYISSDYDIFFKIKKSKSWLRSETIAEFWDFDNLYFKIKKREYYELLTSWFKDNFEYEVIL